MRLPMPDRLITTLAELHALPVGAIVKPADPDNLAAWYRRDSYWLWIGISATQQWVWNTTHLPVQLIWTPKENNG